MPEAEAAAPATPPGNGHAVLSADEIKERLLAIVSERTGYPAEMLELAQSISSKARLIFIWTRLITPMITKIRTAYEAAIAKRC